MAVAAPENHGPVRNDGVDEFLARERAGPEGRHQPAATLDPGLIRMRVRILLDDVDITLDGRDRIQVAAVGLDSARDRVNVRVLEAGDDHAPLEVDDLRLRADVVPGTCVRADIDDAAVVDRDRLRPAARAVHRVDGAAPQRKIGNGRFFLIDLLGSLARAAGEHGRGQENADRATELHVQMIHYWKSLGMVCVHVFSRTSLPFSVRRRR